MATIQKVWLHGQSCSCDKCESIMVDGGIIVDAKGVGIIISSKMSTFMQDQNGQRYIITPIPDME